MTVASSNADAVGLLLSGGLDSGILLGHLLRGGRRVQPFYVRSQLVWEEAELAAAQAFLKELAPKESAPLVVLEMPLSDLYGEHWSIGGRHAPGADSPDEAVYLPGRNALLTIKPALWCAMHGIEELALAVLASNPFGDATDDFFRSFEAALERATGSRGRLTRPFAHLEKKAVMELGRDLPLELTFSCIAPIGSLHCGQCNKCAERQRAFRAVGAADPTEYANGRAIRDLTLGIRERER
jgi:7-cyano-7-deazaguanine synthase